MNTRTMSLFLAGAFGFAALVFGCSTDFAVPQEAQLGCKGASDCPSGWTCNEKVGRCVKTENIEQVNEEVQAAMAKYKARPSKERAEILATLTRVQREIEEAREWPFDLGSLSYFIAAIAAPVAQLLVNFAGSPS